MIRDRVGNRDKAIFLAGGAAAVIALALVSVHAAGAGLPAIEAHGGDIDANGNDIQNVGSLPGFFDTQCGGSEVVSQVFDNGTYNCIGVSNTLSEVLTSGNSAGAENIDMNGNNVSNVGWLNPEGTQLDINGTVSLSPDGDAVDANNIRDAGVVYAQAITGADAPSYNFQVASENHLRFVADRDASTGGAYVWIIDMNDGSLNAEGALNMSDHVIEHVADPTSDTEVGDRGYNDGRYVELSGDSMTGNLTVGSGNTGRITIDSSQTSPYIETITEGSMELNTPSGNIKMLLPTGNSCTFDVDANLNCDGSKNWVHDLNETHEAVYSSQESPQVRAVVEDTATITGGETVVELPDHFSGTVGSDEDMMVQVTPHSLATVAAVQRNTTHLTVAADRDVSVDYRVTGIRDGFEDKQVVRPQAET